MKPIYKLRLDGKVYGDQFSETLRQEAPTGTMESYCGIHGDSAGLQVEGVALRDAEFAVTKYSVVFTNQTDHTVRLSQLDAGISFAASELLLQYYVSDWGAEFHPQERNIDAQFSFGVTAGRSGKGYVPWAGLVTPGRCYSAALAWSGSWTCAAAPEQGRFHFTMGHSWEGFYTDVPPHASFSSAAFYLAEGATMEQACLQMRRYFRSRLSLLKDGGTADVPLEYNGWFPYEDTLITEDIYLENAKLARQLGCRYAVMDAGWFGGNEEGQGWYEKRGDWDIVNKQGFPSGMKALCDHAKELGILPGIWCEIEAVGKNAALNETHGHIIAKREGKSLGYVCMGSEQGRAWAMSVVDRILGEYGAKWIKFDFNLDPAPGCDAPDHGHGAGDGLHAHYTGYYRLLREIHEKYPDVVIENCASGSLRNDIGIMSHTHWNHISDPDYTPLHLQCFWGSLSYLHQSACLHFSWSEVRQKHNLGVLNPISPDMPRHKLDYYIRSVLMGIPGFSYRLAALPQWCADRLRELMDFYAQIYEAYILNGDAYRLTPQPLKDGGGERFPVFEFVSGKREAVVFAFRLADAPAQRRVYPQGLRADCEYVVSYMDGEKSATVTGRELETRGLVFSGMPEESSEVVWICLKAAEEALSDTNDQHS